MARVLLVSNRLPITTKVEHHRLVTSPSSGGLATGLRHVQDGEGTLWIGWPGDTSRMSAEMRAKLQAALAEMHCAPVPLTPFEVTHFYDGFSNAVLWPLFHYLLDRIPVHTKDWEVYQRVNERFAEAVVAHHRPGDLIWVHDYQLALVPSLLRRKLPNARIGYFLHIPFPATEIFRTLPWREAILDGILGADLVGFHTRGYRRHFANAVERILELQLDEEEHVHVGDRRVDLGVFPMGVDIERLRKLVDDPSVQAEVDHLKEEAAGRSVRVGVDRLDYTKGMRRRLLAFERLLETTPQIRGKVRLVQVAVPSRDKVASYQAYRREVHETVGRINGAYGTLEWVPIHYVHRPLSEHELVALYRAASVMLVTPLRDGMNLVAKEFVACRTDDDGVLLLSEFAGAAAEMGEALLINPYDVEAMALAYRRAIDMSVEERRFRMRALRARVETNDVHHWSKSYIDALTQTATVELAHPAETSHAAIEALGMSLNQRGRLLFLLDYDGTLIPFAPAPDLATPDAALLDLLRSLAHHPGFEVHIVSGRRRETLERWLGELPVGLHAEHGFWSRALPPPKMGGQIAPVWTAARELDVPWKIELRNILERFTLSTPGALIEEKTASLAWHYRMAEPELAAARAREVRGAVGAFVRGLPLEIIEGDKVIEVRLRGIDKGVVAAAIVAGASPGTTVIAMGDDFTDVDLFRALPKDAVTIAVGSHPVGAQYRVDSPRAARAFLASLVRLAA